ncbi:hypothetical protein CC1G_05667 [Coprinopsis cinerea okayama7|uniref:Uncharacterized protein n=1 Tax=Coprinopsis cinerea (strain Okayama-7 / 130 / ATCC MYA-4618 / FGSC 9003) TaxID=240176 RepID=A8N9U0_COPC7|nr:hypothetical protein CC1G_05667 [Coprinopsis cinerea okayama7\|eukprot:XP_001831596.1 hypothetical protein CC1G_05667 [Coprinopsis cinerea okayama7\
MDIDWCLTCSKHLDNTTSPYCSWECRPRAGPSNLCSYPHQELSYDAELDDEQSLNDDDDAIYHTVNDVSHHYSGIEAWAAAIPAGAPCEEPRPVPAKRSRPPSVRSSRSSISSPTSVSTVTYRPPELLKPHRPVPPTLCMSTPRTVPSSPSLPIVTPQQQIAEFSTAAYSGGTMSTGHTSIESSLATPASTKALPFSDRKSSSMLDSIASHVRSWVAPSPFSKHDSNPCSDDDEATPVFVAPPSKHHPRTHHMKAIHDELHPSYRSRGRKASRAVA